MIAADLQPASPSGKPPAKVWVVVVTRPFQERRAKRELEQQGFEVYLPMKLAETRKRELVTGPFFPRYLFARVDLQMEHWKAIWNTFGVHGLLGTVNRPTGVADSFIERIRAQEDAGFIKIGLAEEQASFGKGERVVTLDGFAFEGVFAERIDEKRARILVSFLGGDSPFIVDIRKLRAAEAS